MEKILNNKLNRHEVLSDDKYVIDIYNNRNWVIGMRRRLVMTPINPSVRRKALRYKN